MRNEYLDFFSPMFHARSYFFFIASLNVVKILLHFYNQLASYSGDEYRILLLRSQLKSRLHANCSKKKKKSTFLCKAAVTLKC